MIRARFTIITLLLVTVLFLGNSCLYIETSPPATSPVTTTPSAPALPSAPINPGWTPPPAGTATPTLQLPNIADVVASVKPSVVAINTEVVSLDFFNRPFTQQGAGSGWIIDSNGIIVTNNHVVEGAKTISATLDDGRTFTADPDKVFTDPLNDLAIFKIDVKGLPAVKIGDSTRLRVGDWVVTIGNSLGLGISAKEGIISRKGVSISVSQGQTLFDLIETSAAINPGNSGGPLVNMSGEVIGMTSAKIATSGVEGMGYAISMETAIPIIEALIKNGYVVRPWLGVSLHTVDQFIAARYNLAVGQGALITQVAPGSPADIAGLEDGDVIVRLGNQDVTTAEELVRFIHANQIGQPTTVTYWRGNAQKTAQVTPAETPPP